MAYNGKYNSKTSLDEFGEALGFKPRRHKPEPKEETKTPPPKKPVGPYNDPDK